MQINKYFHQKKTDESHLYFIKLIDSLKNLLLTEQNNHFVLQNIFYGETEQNKLLMKRNILVFDASKPNKLLFKVLLDKLKYILIDGRIDLINRALHEKNVDAKLEALEKIDLIKYALDAFSKFYSFEEIPKTVYQNEIYIYKQTHDRLLWCSRQLDKIGLDSFPYFDVVDEAKANSVVKKNIINNRHKIAKVFAMMCLLSDGDGALKNLHQCLKDKMSEDNISQYLSQKINFFSGSPLYNFIIETTSQCATLTKIDFNFLYSYNPNELLYNNLLSIRVNDQRILSNHPLLNMLKIYSHDELLNVYEVIKVLKNFINNNDSIISFFSKEESIVCVSLAKKMIIKLQTDDKFKNVEVSFKTLNSIIIDVFKDIKINDYVPSLSFLQVLHYFFMRTSLDSFAICQQRVLQSIIDDQALSSSVDFKKSNA